jgi:hypothetical protein
VNREDIEVSDESNFETTDHQNELINDDDSIFMNKGNFGHIEGR